MTMNTMTGKFEKKVDTREMIEFITSAGEKIYLSYAEIAKEFLDSPLSEEERDAAVNLIIFMDFLQRKRDLKFVKMRDSDWEGLWIETRKLIQKEKALKVA